MTLASAKIMGRLVFGVSASDPLTLAAVADTLSVDFHGGIGIYGVMAYAVTRRTREIGIRIALGAERADVIRMVLREALSLTAIGSAIGVIIAAAMSRVLAGFLFGIPPADPITLVGTTVLFATIGLACSRFPSRSTQAGRDARTYTVDAGAAGVRTTLPDRGMISHATR